MDLVVAIESLGDNHLCTRVVWSPQVSKLKLLQTLPGAWHFNCLLLWAFCKFVLFLLVLYWFPGL